ncbi:hypothetical protein BDN70DRAFT_403502 [Pholiota conissans]|uniref:FHA domain-containing protein n=1 Tax=Pholiota conissans TaxID=109636 RepID=A0A9P5Z851_9AGAR|nr:hypothetical protein BDN70DRAFT_403502 [Pholiota conissans]
MPVPTLTLFSVSGSFPFQTKHLPLSTGTKVTLGSTEGPSGGARQPARVAANNNGWFPPKHTGNSTVPPVSPLPLSSSHAEVWMDSGIVYIRDLESAFGTFVNGLRITQNTPLKTGDTITLGSRIPRNEKTPAYITDLHLSPVIIKVSLS